MEMAARIGEILSGSACIVGMGNCLRMDDAVGCWIAERVKDATSGVVPVINAEDIIEGYVYTIADMPCRDVLIVDAVEADAEIGSVVFGRLEEMGELVGGLSTHKLSLTLSGKILRAHEKNTWFLGIVAGNTDFGTGMCAEVRESAAIVSDLLVASIAQNRTTQGVPQ